MRSINFIDCANYFCGVSCLKRHMYIR